jgi:hypothetical protein
MEAACCVDQVNAQVSMRSNSKALGQPQGSESVVTDWPKIFQVLEDSSLIFS